MEELSINELLRDFVSIKLPKKKREFINSVRKMIDEKGCIPLDVKIKIRQMSRLYTKQFRELHASRERARRTNWKRREGITEEQAVEMVERRRKDEAARKADIGI